MAARLLARGEELAADDDPSSGRRRSFSASYTGATFYNRVPVRAALNGTFRCWPNRTWASVEAEFARLLGDVSRPEGLEASLRLLSNGLGYEVSPEEPLVAALRGPSATWPGGICPWAGPFRCAT